MPFKKLFAEIRSMKRVVGFLLVFFVGLQLRAEYRLPEDTTFRRQLLSIPEAVDFSLATEVRGHVSAHLTESSQQSAKWFDAAQRHVPMVQAWISDKGLPGELAFLPLAMSHLNPAETLGEGRGGWWQMHYLTAFRYGLKVEHFVDERRDWVKSSEAALLYLEDLHRQMGDWTSAVLAFMGSPAEVVAARNRSCSGDASGAWVKALPSHVQMQFSEFAAFSYLCRFGPKPLTQEVMGTPKEVVDVEKKRVYARYAMDVPGLVTSLGISQTHFLSLNPSLKSSWLPAGEALFLPLSSHNRWKELNDTLQGPLHKNGSSLVIQDHASFERIIRAHGLHLNQVYALNGINPKDWNEGAKTLLFPKEGIALEVIEEPMVSTSQDKESSVQWYKVRSGDTLWRIAGKYPGVSPENIMDWNNLRSDRIQIGQRLKIFSGS